MMKIMLKSKIWYATVTDAQLYYTGSITIDEQLMGAAGLREHEKVEVLNLNSGARIETYVIKGESGRGDICLNGPAARTGCVGDKVVILCYGIYSEDELKKLAIQFVELDEQNKIKNSYLGQ